MPAEEASGRKYEGVYSINPISQSGGCEFLVETGRFEIELLSPHCTVQYFSKNVSKDYPLV